MATTIASGTLTVKLTESVSLNGTAYSAVNNLVIAAINEIQQRIVTVPNSTLVKLYDFTGIGTGSGSYDRTTLKYLRITNKDDTNNISINLLGTASNTWTEITPGASFIIATGVGISQGVASGTVGTPTLENLVTVTAYSGLTNNVDVECYVAMT
jgi:hypothetical protein